MKSPKFTYEDIKYSEGRAMFKRAQALFKAGKVKQIREDPRGYSATVKSTHPYEVSVSMKSVDVGYCNCYMGQNDTLCKHMLALALAVLNETGALGSEESLEELSEVKRRVSTGLRKIKAYTGPSKIWFSYQRSLSVGAGMISSAIANLPASKENADYLWKLVLRISKKLATGGVDDSDGTVGGCVYEILAKLAEFAKEKPELKPIILEYSKDDTGFGFEDELRNMIK